MISEILVGIIVGIVVGTASTLLSGFITGLFGRGVCHICKTEYENLREKFEKKGRSLGRVIPGGRWKYEQEGGKALIRRTWWGKPSEVWLKKDFGDDELLMWKPSSLNRRGADEKAEEKE